MTTKTNILETANTIINGERQGLYGVPEDNFGVIARLWNVYLGARLTGSLQKSDVAALMILMKVARIRGGQYKEDNWVDIAGYAACGGECHSMEQEDSEDGV